MKYLRMKGYVCWDCRLHCEDCGADVEQALGSSGQTGDDDQRRARKAVGS
jgi:hypothetical protein